MRAKQAGDSLVLLVLDLIRIRDLTYHFLTLNRAAEANSKLYLGSRIRINRFKEISDTFGHHWGNRLLQQVGVRLREAVSRL